MTYAIISCYVLIFLWLAYLDYKTHKIPNVIILPAMAIVTALNCTVMPVGWQWTLYGGGIGLICAVIFFILGVRSGGDLKMLVFVGLATGYPIAFFAIPLITIISGFLGLIYKWLKHKKWQDKIPYGTYLGIGTAITLLLSLYVL